MLTNRPVPSLQIRPLELPDIPADTSLNERGKGGRGYLQSKCGQVSSLPLARSEMSTVIEEIDLAAHTASAIDAVPGHIADPTDRRDEFRKKHGFVRLSIDGPPECTELLAAATQLMKVGAVGPFLRGHAYRQMLSVILGFAPIAKKRGMPLLAYLRDLYRREVNRG